nr:copper transport protein ATOX1-like isoform X1 [Salvelinus alpinus]
MREPNIQYNKKYRCRPEHIPSCFIKSQKQEFFVDMTCEGCSGAVTRVLNKLGGVQFEIDLPNKKVFIESDKDTDVLLETLKKTGKAANYIGPK